MVTKALLLGAGASAPAHLPMSQELTRTIVERASTAGRPFTNALNFAVGALIGYDTQRGASPLDLPDAERLFSALSLLANRDELEVSPFVANWDSAVGVLDQWMTSVTAPDVGGAIKHFLGPNGARYRLEEAFRNFVRHAMGRPSSPRSVFAEVLGLVLAKLREALVLPPEADLAYLLPIFELWRSQGSLKVATLNYDLTIETAAQSAGVECDTGVESWARDGNFEWASQAVHLIKLHGSLDWSSTPSIATGPPAWQLPASTFAKADENTAARDLGLVFGQRDKLRPDGPYLGLLAQFEAHLRQTGELVVIGYSFRDAHVNEMIARWANADRTRLLTVVDPFFPELPPTAPGWFGRRDFQTSVIKALWYNGSESEPPENPRLTVYRESVASCLPADLPAVSRTRVVW